MLEAIYLAIIGATIFKLASYDNEDDMSLFDKVGSFVFGSISVIFVVWSFIVALPHLM